MKGQKIITKCLFLLALIFLSLIFFFLKENNGMDDAIKPKESGAEENRTERPSQSLTPRADGAASEASLPEVNPEPPSATPTPAALLPPSGMDPGALALLAVFQAHSPLASAVIHTEGEGAHRYHVGAELPEGGVLADIRSTEVIIRDGDRRITLRMGLRGGGGRAEIADADDEAPASDDDGPKMPQRVLDFLSKFDLKPVSEHSPDGYRVGEDFPESGTEELGIEPGDTIVAVNGYPVGEYHSDYLVWLSFKDRYRASVLVRTEEGDEFTFHFPDDVKGVSLPGTGG